MANIKSAKKRVLVNQTKALRNKMIKSGVKTAVKKVDAAIAAGDKEAAKAALLSATSVIDKEAAAAALVAATSEINKAATKGVYHKNTSSRKIGRMTVAVNKMN